MVNARTFNRQIGVDIPHTGDQSDVQAQMYGPATAWQTLGGYLWASVEPISGTEGVQGSGVTPAVLYRVRTRYRPDITSRCRVRLPDPRGSESGLPSFGDGLYGSLLDVISVIDEGGQRKVLQIMCQDNTNA